MSYANQDIAFQVGLSAAPPTSPHQAAAEEWTLAKRRLVSAHENLSRIQAEFADAKQQEADTWEKLASVAGRGPPAGYREAKIPFKEQVSQGIYDSERA